MHEWNLESCFEEVFKKIIADQSETRIKEVRQKERGGYAGTHAQTQDQLLEFQSVNQTDRSRTLESNNCKPLACMPACVDAAKQAASCPSCEVGCHRL
mmetsp:Transcript_51286/g.100707  ORF Transcript_51286/g.100707 Transcript_51286/m.100707 type:complete len:98 (-) Transcript_51286:358-651(-)